MRRGYAVSSSGEHHRLCMLAFSPLASRPLAAHSNPLTWDCIFLSPGFVTSLPARLEDWQDEGFAGKPASGLSHARAALQGMPTKVVATGAVRRPVAHATGSEERELLEAVHRLLWKFNRREPYTSSLRCGFSVSTVPACDTPVFFLNTHDVMECEIFSATHRNLLRKELSSSS